MCRIIATMESGKPDEVRCVIQDGEKEVVKTLSFEDYKSTVLGVGVSRIVRVGQLPFGFVDGGAAQGQFEAIIEIPGGRRPIFYFDKEFLVPFPKLVFYLFAENNHVVSSCVVAKGKEGRYYYYPYGNVYQDAHICWGGNALPLIENLKDFDKIVNLFFSAGTKDDLYRGPKMTVEGKEVVLTQRDLIKYVSAMDAFPEELLRPVDAGVSGLFQV